MDRSEIYLFLTKEYGFSPEEIAVMNPHTQLTYYQGPKVVNFSTTEELQAFLKARGKA